jgi:hypothetical protein
MRDVLLDANIWEREQLIASDSRTSAPHRHFFQACLSVTLQFRLLRLCSNFLNPQLLKHEIRYDFSQLLIFQLQFLEMPQVIAGCGSGHGGGGQLLPSVKRHDADAEFVAYFRLRKAAPRELIREAQLFENFLGRMLFHMVRSGPEFLCALTDEFDQC